MRACVCVSAWMYVHMCVLASERWSGAYTVTPWALLCTCGIAKEGKGGESRLITEVVHPSESIVIILVISPIYALSHFNQRSIKEAAAERARLIEFSSILRGRKSLGVRSASVRSNRGSIVNETEALGSLSMSLYKIVFNEHLKTKRLF